MVVVEKTTMLLQLGLGYRGSLHMSQQHGGVGDWEEAWRRDGGGGEAAAAVGPRLPRVLAQVTAEASPGGLGSRRGRKDGEEGMVGVVEKTTMLPQLGLGYRGSFHMSQQHGGVGDWEGGWRRDGGGEAAALQLGLGC